MIRLNPIHLRSRSQVVRVGSAASFNLTEVAENYWTLFNAFHQSRESCKSTLLLDRNAQTILNNAAAKFVVQTEPAPPEDLQRVGAVVVASDCFGCDGRFMRVLFQHPQLAPLLPRIFDSTLASQPPFLWATEWGIPLRRAHVRAGHPRQSWDILCRRWMAELRTLPSLYRTHGVAGLQEALDLAYIEVSQQRTSHQEMMLLHAYKKLLSNTAGLVQAVLTAYIGIYRLTSGLDDLLPLESVMAWSHLFELAEDQKMQDGTYNEVKQGMVAALTDLSAADFLDNCVRFGLAAPLIWSPPIPPKLSVKGNESLRGLERLGETVRSQYISKVAEKLIMTVRNEDRGTLVRFAGSEDLFERLWEVSRPELIPGELEDVRPQHSPKSPQSCTRRFVRWNRPRELIKEVRSLPVADRTSIGRLLLKTVLLQLQTVFCMSIVEGIVFYCLRRSSTSKASIRKEALAMSFGLWSDAIITSCCSDEKSDNERWGCLSILDWTHTLGRTEAVNDFRPTSVEQAIEDAILALRTAMTEALSVLELVKELPWASRVETDWRDLMKCLSHLERQQLSSFPKEVHAYTSMNRRLTFHERGCQECLEEECPVLLSLVIEADEGLKRAFRDYWTRRETIKAEERWVLDSAENSKDLPQPPTPSCGEQPPIPSASEKELALFKWHGSGLRPQLTTCTPACKPARSAPAQLNIGTLVIQSNA